MSSPFRLCAAEPDERTVQEAILRYLALDRRVAWAERFNTGAHVLEDTKPNGKKSRRFIKYAFKGCSDILGQTVDGRFLAVEVKARTGKQTTDQKRFLSQVNGNNGIGCVARSVEEVQHVLDAAEIARPLLQRGVTPCSSRHPASEPAVSAPDCAGSAPQSKFLPGIRRRCLSDH